MRSGTDREAARRRFRVNGGGLDWSVPRGQRLGSEP
jgi:hypothetical protein